MPDNKATREMDLDGWIIDLPEPWPDVEPNAAQRRTERHAYPAACEFYRKMSGGLEAPSTYTPDNYRFVFHEVTFGLRDRRDYPEYRLLYRRTTGKEAPLEYSKETREAMRQEMSPILYPEWARRSAAVESAEADASPGEEP